VIFEIAVVRLINQSKRDTMSTVIKTKLYKDFNMKHTWDEGCEFEVEFKGDKARVKSNVPFSNVKVSRFNKLTPLGSWTGGGQPGKYQYSLTVDGKKTYMIVEYKIPSHE
jgi:hypothetical protein